MRWRGAPAGSDRKEVQLALEAARAQFVEARLIGEEKTAKLQRFLLVAVGMGLLISTGLGTGTFVQYRQTLKSERLARISEVQALVSSSDGLFASHRRLDALIEAIRGVVYSRDGTFVATVSEDNTLIMWNVQRILNLDLLGYGCDRVESYLQTNRSVEDSDRHLCDRYASNH